MESAFCDVSSLVENYPKTSTLTPPTRSFSDTSEQVSKNHVRALSIRIRSPFPNMAGFLILAPRQAVAVTQRGHHIADLNPCQETRPHNNKNYNREKLLPCCEI